ncbi:thioesterase family protein [Sphingomonas koreensis]|nr:thioesterase family protein [Sphingomonas koreensis]
MTPLREILAAARPTDTGFTATIPADWMQGRTTYGGLSSALALYAAQHCEPDLPPLRSVQVSFIGPLAGAVTVTATKLRRGRNAAFIQSDITSDAGLGYRATFVFMSDQPSRLSLDEAAGHDRPAPAPDAKLYTGPDEFFTGNFNFLDLKEPDLSPAELLRWARLRDSDGLDPMFELMAVADALPPAAFKLLGNVHAPVSSLTWIVNLLTPRPATRDGWWLLHARADQAKNGCSSQSMAIWNADGQRVAEGMQSVAIFA